MSLQEDGSMRQGSDGPAVVVVGRRQGLKKGPWTAAEDSILIEYVRKHGEGNWNAVQKNSGLNRCGKSCRLRWANHLRPNLKKGAITAEEERLIIDLHVKFGNKWARMAAQLPGRTDNEIKNYWNTRVKRRQRVGLPIYPQEAQHMHHQPLYHHYHHQHQNQNHLQSVQQTALLNSSPSSLSSLLSPPPPPPPPPPQPMLYGQNPSYKPTGTLFDALNYHPPTQNPNSSYLPDPLPNQCFRVLRDNNTGGLALTLCSSPPPLNHQGLITPNFPPKHSHQFDPLSFGTNQNSINFNTNQNSIVGAQPELHSMQDSNGFNDNAGGENMVALLLSDANDNYEIAPELMRGNSGLLGDLLDQSQAFVQADEKLKGEKSLVEEIGYNVNSETGDFGSTDSMSAAHSSAATKAKDGMEEMNIMDDDLLSLLDFQQTVPVPDWYDGSDGISTEQSTNVMNDNVGIDNQQVSPQPLIENTSMPTSNEWDSLVSFWYNMPSIIY